MHYYQFNIGDYQSHTSHLSDIEDLVYRRMLDWCYLHEKPLPVDFDEISRLIRMRSHSDSIEIVLQEFFVNGNEGWFSERVNKEINHFRDKVDKASKAGKASAERRFNGRSTDVQPTNNQEPINNNHKPNNIRDVLADRYQDAIAVATQSLPNLKPVVNENFEEFWKAYPKKTGKDLARTAFAKRKVNNELLQTMLKAIAQQKNTDQWKKDNGQFIPMPATWLNQGRWQDEISSTSNDYMRGVI